MLEQIKFINHINESINWGKKGIYVNYSDLHDYSWNFTSDNNRISSFSKGIVQKTIPIVICCDSEEQGILLKNRLMEYAEKDVLASQSGEMHHGKLIIGDYYLKCFISGSKKGKYLVSKGYMEVTLTVTTDYPQWRKESIVSFRTNGAVITDTSQEISVKRNFDFNYDFNYDFASGMRNKTLNNTSFVGTNFKMIIFGAAVNPAIHIDGHTYEVKCLVQEGEYLTIDSFTKTVMLTRQDGTEINQFNLRNRDSYIFEKIPSGNNVVTWSSDFGFDVILFEERSEPKWT